MRERELFLQLTDALHVVGAVARDAADHGDHGGRRVDHPTHPAGLTACPARRHDEPVALIRTGGAAADVREVVGPGVHELQHVVRTVGVGDMQPDRPAGEVELGDRAERVVTDGGPLGAGVRRSARVREVIERGGRQRADTHLREVLGRREVEDQRIPVDVRLGGKSDELFRRIGCSSHECTPSVTTSTQTSTLERSVHRAQMTNVSMAMEMIAQIGT